MLFRILGPVGIDGKVAIPGERVRTLLAALLLRPGQVVPTEQLLYDVWGEELPSKPRSAIQAAASRLRLAPAGAGEIDVRHELGGYRLDLTGHELDLSQFRDGVAAAAAAGPERRVELLTEALRWHEGEVLRGATNGTLAARFAPVLRDEWLAAREQRAEAWLQLGRVDEALVELTALTTDYPLREHAWLLLLKTLHQAGRVVDALSAYEKVRQLLAEELGTDPSVELREQHQLVLRGEIAAPWTVRTRLPLPVTGFIGRDDELTKALELLTNDDGLPIVVLSGLAGVGKTALAVRIGHAAKPTFTDGSWLVRLGGRPTDDVLVELLGFCGVGVDVVPGDARGRTELLREAMTGRRVLLILDDARAADEVQAVLPNAAGCAVIVTSRSSLGELAITSGANGTLLEPLSLTESASFLQQAMPAADSGVLEDLAGLCAGLPLALRIAAAGARALPAAKLSSYVGRLRDDRLARLSRADPGVSGSFDLSYDALPERLRRLFGLLGLHPDNDFGPGVATALLGANAGHGLEELADAGLLIRTDLDRYTFHDLVREYAAGKTVGDRESARRRMIDWYLHSALATHRILQDGGVARCLDPISAGVEPARFTDERTAYDWLATEWDNLVALVPEDNGWQVAGLIWPYVRDRRRWQDHRALYRQAVDAARSQGRLDGEAWLLWCLGAVQLYDRDLTGAEQTFETLRALSRQTQDRENEAAALHGAAMVLHWRGAYADAVPRYRCALELAQRPIPRAQALNNLADCHYQLGALTAALDTAADAVRTYRAVGNQLGTAIARGTLAEICLSKGDVEIARQHITSTLSTAHDLDAVVLEAEATALLALVHEAAGEPTLALQAAHQARDLLRAAGTNPVLARVAHLTAL